MSVGMCWHIKKPNCWTFSWKAAADKSDIAIHQATSAGKLCTALTPLTKRKSRPCYLCSFNKHFPLVPAAAIAIKTFSGFAFKMYKVIGSSFQLCNSFELLRPLSTAIVLKYGVKYYAQTLNYYPCKVHSNWHMLILFTGFMHFSNFTFRWRK